MRVGLGATTRRRATVLRIALALVACLLALEVGARAFWWSTRGISLRDPGLILQGYYPKLWEVYRHTPSRGDARVDVLFLGASVLHPDWGVVERQLREQLAADGHRKVRVLNLATPAHTTRDSLYAYQALSDFTFDLVFVYHGINETRTNNAPPEVFRPDYGHYAWYGVLNAVAPYHGRAHLSLPYTLRYLGVRARQVLRPESYIPEHVPRQEWTRYGGDLRSPGAFEDNLRGIVALAEEHGDPLLLSTFASHVPDDYSAERFAEGRLDYLLHEVPLGIWGRPEHVKAGIAAHNQVVRRVARETGALFVDQARLLAGSAENFNDASHLTTTGSRRFVENLIAALPEEVLAGTMRTADAARPAGSP